MPNKAWIFAIGLGFFKPMEEHPPIPLWIRPRGAKSSNTEILSPIATWISVGYERRLWRDAPRTKYGIQECLHRTYLYNLFCEFCILGHSTHLLAYLQIVKRFSTKDSQLQITLVMLWTSNFFLKNWLKTNYNWAPIDGPWHSRPSADNDTGYTFPCSTTKLIFKQ